jgi:hypothetical protein
MKRAVRKAMSHNERCKDCKVRVKELLEQLYGQVELNYRFRIPTKPEEFRNNPQYEILNEIYTALQKYRNFNDFVRASYVDVDFYLPDQNIVIEFDESQHFTEARRIALLHYPENLPLGFSPEKWVRLCDSIQAMDNDPPYRDEQRAWYDVIRDFLPQLAGIQKTVRIFAGDMTWCTLNTGKFEDIKKFKQTIEDNPNPAKPTKISPWPTKTENDRYILDAFIWFEYLLNKLKLQYLIDCFEGTFNLEAPYLKNPQNEQKILNSRNGRAFKAYFNMHIRNVGYEGPLIKDRNPGELKVVKDITELNELLKQSITTSDNWLALFSEYLLIKTVVHEIYVDTVYEENKLKYGLPTLEDLIVETKNNEKISLFQGKKLRDYIINSLLLGIDPSGNTPSQLQQAHLMHSNPGSFDRFLSQRKEWVGIAYRDIGKNQPNMKKENLASVLQWDRNSLCAFDAGPVFIRKRKEFLVPLFCQSISMYDKWNSTLSLREKLDEAMGNDVNILVGSYWEYFLEGQNLNFIENNKHYAEIMRKIEKELDARFQALDVAELAEIYHHFSGHIEMPRSISSSQKQITRAKPVSSQGNGRINQIADIFEKKNTILPPVKRRIFNNHTQIRFYHPEWPKIDNKPNQSIYYEINDWNCYGKKEIRIEIQFWNEFFVEIGEKIHEKSEFIRNKMPQNPSVEWNTTTSAGLNRLQYLYQDTANPEQIAQSMEILIKNTQDMINEWLKAKLMGHY